MPKCHTLRKYSEIVSLLSVIHLWYLVRVIVKQHTLMKRLTTHILMDNIKFLVKLSIGNRQDSLKYHDNDWLQGFYQGRSSAFLKAAHLLAHDCGLRSKP